MLRLVLPDSVYITTPLLTWLSTMRDSPVLTFDLLTCTLLDF